MVEEKVGSARLRFVMMMVLVMIRSNYSASFHGGSTNRGRGYVTHKLSPIKTTTELGPNYPASKSNIHPAPKFRFKEEQVALIKEIRKPNWVELGDLEEKKVNKNSSPAVASTAPTSTSLHPPVTEQQQKKSPIAQTKQAHEQPHQQTQQQKSSTLPSKNTVIVNGEEDKIKKDLDNESIKLSSVTSSSHVSEESIRAKEDIAAFMKVNQVKVSRIRRVMKGIRNLVWRK